MKKNLIFQWQQSLKFWSLLKDLLASFGTLWLLIEVASYFSSSAEVWLTSKWWLFLFIGITYTLYSNRPRTYFSYNLNNRDVVIEYFIGDAFSLSGALIVPINSVFDTTLGGIVARSSSIQAQVLSKIYDGNSEHLDHDIQKALLCEGYQHDEIIEIGEEKKARYKIGTVIQLRNKNRLFYFLAHTHISKNKRAEGTTEDLSLSLAKLWYYIAEKGDKGDIVIPLLGTGNARIRSPLSREEVVKLIVKSFIASCSEKNYCNKLTITILPEDIPKYKMNISNLDEFLRYSCKYADIDPEPKKGGGEQFKNI